MLSGKEIAAVLYKAAALVRTGWCRNAPAKNSDGEPVGPRDADAVCWCAIGAIQRICGGPEDGWAARAAIRDVVCMEVATWNDTYARDGEMVARIMEEAAHIVHAS